MVSSDKDIVSKCNNIGDRFKKEFRKENLSLNFEKNSEFMKKDPEEVKKILLYLK